MQRGRVRRKASSSSRTVIQLKREDLRQLVLELFAPPPSKTFAELARAWLRRIAARRVCPENERRHIRHMRALARLREGELTKGAIDECFGALLKPVGPLGAATMNKLRSTGRLIIRDAQGNGDWRGLNPFELVPRFRQARVLHPVLTLREARRLLPCLRLDYRRLSHVQLLLGFRPGEAYALRKVDVELEERMVTVRRSHARNQTKTGKERRLPIPDELITVFRAAMRASSSEYVFPKPNGNRRSRNGRPSTVLRTALKHAGITKPLRFYDLRHTASTLHRLAGCDPLVIREMMGHGSKNQTDDTYTHLEPAYQRRQLNKLRLTRSTR